MVSIAPAEIENQFTSLVDTVLGRVLDVWLASYHKTIASFQQSSEALAGRLGETGGEELSLSKIWSHLEDTFDEYLAWTCQLDVEDSDWFSRLFLDIWESEFRKILEALPASLEIPIEDSFWEAGQEDSPRVRTWKWAKRRQRGFRRTVVRVRNAGRKIVRKPPRTPAPASRTVDLRNFLEYELAAPTAHILLGEWQRFLQQAAVEFFYFHGLTEAIENDSLFPNEPDSSRIRLDSASAASRREKVQRQLNDLVARFSRIEEFRGASFERLGEGRPAIVEAFRKKWDSAGTFALPNRRFGRPRIERSRRRLKTDFEKAKQAWQRHYGGEKEEWQKDIELCRLQLQVTRICAETVEAVSGRIEQIIIPTLDNTLARIKIHTEKITEFKTPSKSELKNVLTTENKSLSKDLRLNLLPVIVDALANVEFDALLQNFPRQIKEALNAFPERNEIFQERDLKSLVPASKINDVPVRALVLDEIFPRLVKDNDALLAEVKRISDELFRDVSQIDQIVDYNSESALALLEEKKGTEAIEEAHRMAGEGLDRAGNQAAGLIAKTRSVASLVSENLAESSERFINSLQDLENSEKIIQMKLRYARAQAKKRIQRIGVRTWEKIKASLSTALAFTRATLRRTRAAYYRLRKLSGLIPGELGLEDKLALFLHRTQGRIASLPYVYQRLFRIEPLTDKRFYIGRDADRAALKESFMTWQAGQYAATALVGEKGSGKTTLLNFATAEFFKGLPLRKIDLVNTTIQTVDELFELLKKLVDRPDAGTLDALERELAASEEKSICILENSQNMFLRTVGGFEAIERFLLFMSRTNTSVLWIVTCTLYSWNFLDRVFQVSQYFKRVIKLGSLTREKTTDLIMKRHRISGYLLHFEIPEPQAQPRKFRKIAKPAEQQAFLQDWFFEQLNRLAAGNVAVAMWFWLSAIKSIVQKDLTVTPVIDFDYSFLHQMGRDEMFTLAALLQHETLTAEEHAIIFHQGIDESLLLLNRLLNKKYLTVSEGRFAIHALLYRPSVAALKIKNIIH
jgi:hypothetical protein